MTDGIDDSLEILQDSLDAAILALDDWLNVYAEELCDPVRVAEAKERLNERGTLWYIGTTVEKCKEARDLLKT